jgi:hypothetical protein
VRPSSRLRRIAASCRSAVVRAPLERAGASCPQSVPGSPRARYAGEGRVEPGQTGISALGISSTLGEGRRGLRFLLQVSGSCRFRAAIRRLPRASAMSADAMPRRDRDEHRRGRASSPATSPGGGMRWR